MGPTILTLPSVLKRIFAEADRRLEDYIELLPLDPQWRCFFQDRSVLDLVSETEKMQPLKIRQSVIAHLLKNGNDLRVVQVFAGHKRASATEGYKQSGLEQLKAIIDKLHPLQ